MKKLSNILVTLGVIIFLLSFGMKSEAVGQCPSGASTTTIDFVINGCTWRATICYECPVALGPTWFAVTKLNLISGGPCDNWSIAKDSIEQRLINDPTYIIGLCTNDIPPCSLSTKRIYARQFICWNKFNDSGNISYNVCDYDSYCVQEYDLCWGEFGPVQTPVGLPYLVGSPASCLGVSEPMENPPHGHSSVCFKINTICD